MYKLLKKDSTLPKSNWEVVYEGSELKCLGEYHKLCKYPFDRHQKLSAIHFKIERNNKR